jgi:hypothetical protein
MRITLTVLTVTNTQSKTLDVDEGGGIVKSAPVKAAAGFVLKKRGK